MLLITSGLPLLLTAMPPRRIENFMDVDSDSDVSITDEPRRKGKGKGKATDKPKRDKGKSKISEVSPNPLNSNER